MRPTLLVIAGPNGAGKTTITVRLRQDHWSEGVEYLNPDDIAQQQFGGWNSVYDNSVDGQEARLCARTQNGELRKIYTRLPDWVAAATDKLPRHASFVDLRAA